MRATPANLVLAAGSGVVAGALVAKCLVQGQSQAEDDEEALFEAAFEAAATSVPAATVNAAAREVELDTLSELIKAEEAKEDDLPAAAKPAAAAPAAPSMPEMPGMPQLPTEDQIKGLVEKKADGARVFRRDDLGIQFEVGSEWLGLEEFVQPTPNGATWMCRLAGPPVMGGPQNRATLTMVIEPVAPTTTVEEYVQTNKKTCEESMGGIARTDFAEDRPHKQGVFTRLLEYTQHLPAMPTPQGMMPPMSIKNINLMTVNNGLAATLQYSALEHFYESFRGAIFELADSFTMFSAVRRYGTLHRRNKGIKVELSSELGYLLYPPAAPQGPPQALVDCFALGGTVVDTYTPTATGSPISLIVDDLSVEEQDAPPKKLAQLVLAGLPDKHKEDVRIFFPKDGEEGDCLEYVVEHLDAPSVPSGKCAVVVYMMRLAPTVRAAIWCKAEEKPGDDPMAFPWLQPSEREEIKTAVREFAKAVKLPADAGDDATSTSFKCNHAGYSMTPGAKGQLKELSVGEICASYQLSADQPLPELQIMKQDRKASLEAWRTECKTELEQQLQGQCCEESQGWLGRDEMWQMVIRLPQPPADGNFNAPPQILCCFLTLLNTADAAWLLQWRSTPEEFEAKRDEMETVIQSFRFYTPK